MSASRVNRLASLGKLTRKRNGKFDPAKAKAEWERNRTPSHHSAAMDGPRDHEDSEVAEESAPIAAVVPSRPATPGYNEIRTRREAIRVQRESLELKRVTGKLVDAALVERAAYQRGVQEREFWLNFPSRVSAVGAAEFGISDSAFELWLDKQIRIALGERSKQKTLMPELADDADGD